MYLHSVNQIFNHMKTIALKLKVVMLFLVLIAPLAITAQTPDDAYVNVTPDTGGYVQGHFYVLLPDTNNLAAIEIQLGSSEGDSDLVNYTFGYDVTGGLPSGFSWNRDGLKLYLNVGSLAATELRFGRVKLRRTGAAWGSAYAFVSN